MNSLIVVGLQFGDEAKGKIVDYLGSKFDAGVRFNGSNNAVHTVVRNNQRFLMSQLPSSVFSKKPMFIAQGCSINPKVLLKEIDCLHKYVGDVKIGIDPRCHVVMPYHRLMDEASERYKLHKIGSTKQGIGFSFEDKTNRHGVRIIDLLDKDTLESRLREDWDVKVGRIEKIYGTKFNLNFQSVIKEFLSYGEKLKPYISLVAEEITEGIKSEKYIFESSQAFYLDYALGTYPYTVAYHTLASSVYAAVGMPIYPIDVLGVVRAYSIRLGNGPFPTEQNNKIGRLLRKIGKEYGAYKKKARRCGWLDLPLLKYSIKMSGVKEIALTKIDVLSGFNKIQVCTEYKNNNSLINGFVDLEKVEPIYTSLEGWQEDITKVRSWKDLPGNCKKYIKYIEEQLGVVVKILSVGPDKEQTIEL